MRTEIIRTRLAELISRDEACAIFGVGGEHGHGYRQRPVLSSSELARLELRLGVSLPAELGRFLKSVHGGGAGPGFGLLVHEDTPRLGRSAEPFPFDHADARLVITRRQSGVDEDAWASLHMPEPREGESPPGPGFLPIAHYGSGVFDVIVVTGEQRGRIWCCDTDWCPLYNSAGEQLGFYDWYQRWLDQSLERFEESVDLPGTSR